MKLHSYFRSSASYRVRIALALKGLPYDYVPVHLVKGEQHSTHYSTISSSNLVPTLVTHDGEALGQSMAIIEYLDEVYPNPPLRPSTPSARAQVRALAQAIACDIHPLNNLRVLQYLTQQLKVDDEAKKDWYRHWARLGLETIERELQKFPASTYCFGDTPTMADCFLVPQIFNAQRFNVPIKDLEKTMTVHEACMSLPAFQSAHPSSCPDAVEV
jgi:maleylacetoacetate isomerase/maleylpyruvate isomerase